MRLDWQDVNKCMGTANFFPISPSKKQAFTVSQMTEEEISRFPLSPEWDEQRTLFSSSKKVALSFCFKVSSYEGYLHWSMKLENLIQGFNEDDYYLDIGAGKAVALQDYLDRYPKGAKVIGIASTRVSQDLEKIKKLDQKDPRFQYYLCDFLQFSTKSLRGRVSFITDIMGAFRYAGDPGKTIRKMGALLKPGGKAVIAYGNQPTISIQGLLSDKISVDKRVRNEGSRLILICWFHSIRGFKVISSRNPLDSKHLFNTTPGKIWDDVLQSDSVVIERTDESVEVEQLTLAPDAVANFHLKNFENISARYHWKTSEQTKKWLITWITQSNDNCLSL